MIDVYNSSNILINHIIILNDVTEKQKQENHIQWLAYHDLLTGLPNQELFIDRFHFAKNLIMRTNKKLILLSFDIDLFKRINDTFGHLVGDKLLIETSTLLKSIIRREDSLSRRGGDEFMLLIVDSDVIKVSIMVSKILKLIAQPYKIEKYEINITASVGISIYPDDGPDFDSVFKAADMAMYQAKRQGRNCFIFSSKISQISSTRMLELENDLYPALENNEFYLLYQPQVSLKNNNIVGLEALVRWKNPKFGIVSPTEFIPLAERTGQIRKIGEWVLRNAVRQLKELIDNGFAPQIVSVNISAIQFHQPDFCDMVINLLEEMKILPQYLALEITEGVLVKEPLAAIKIMERLNKYGVYFMLDDFGTGYSSLNYLKSLPAYKLKIDQSFIANILNDTANQRIVLATIALAKAFGMKTVAEGVETKAQLEYLRLHNCDEIQGYFIAQPLSQDQLKSFLNEFQKNHEK